MIKNISNSRNLIITVISGLLTVIFSVFSFQLDYDPREYIIWSLIFVMMVSRTMNIPYVIIAAVAAGLASYGTSMQLTYSVFIRGALFFSWILINGLVANIKSKQSSCKIANHLYISLIITMLIISFTYLVISKGWFIDSLSTNNKYNEPPTLANFLGFYCTIFNCIIMTLLSEVLCELPIIRKIYNLSELTHSKYVYKYFFIILFISCTFISIYIQINSILISRWNSEPISTEILINEKLKLFLFFCIFLIICKLTLVLKRNNLAAKTENEINEKKINSLLSKVEELNAQLEQQINNRTKDLYHVYSDIESYSYTVSHELKTPIREIDLYAEFIAEDNADTLQPHSIQDIHSIRNICTNMIDLIQNFMEYSKVGYKMLNSESINMKLLIRNCFHQITKTINDRRIELEILDIPDMFADIFLIKQLVFNILSNSVKFTRNIPNAKITIYSREESGMLTYYFKDNGIGFDMKYISHAFNVFERVHNESDYEGNGVGLATVKKIVTRFGGNVEIRGKLNEGCTVTVKFPKNIVLPANMSIVENTRLHDNITIGIISDFGGENSYMTISQKYAYELAVEEINKMGGINGRKIQLIFKDDKSDISLATEMAITLTDIEHVDVIMGGFMSTSREAIREIIDKSKTLYFYNQQYEGGVADHYTFCTSTIPEHQLYPMIEYLFSKHGKKCYIVAADYNFGILSTECVKYFVTKLGGEIIGIEYFQSTKSNFNVTLENIIESKPDIVFSLCVGKNQDNFYKQWFEKGLNKIPIATTVAITESPVHKIYDAPTMENTYVMASFLEELNTISANEFRSKFRKKYSKDIIPHMGLETEAAYSAIYLYKKAVEIANTTETESVIKVLESGMVSFKGPGGTVTIRGEDHQTIRDMVLFRVNEHNEVKPISTYNSLYSDYVENIIYQTIGINGGLKELGLNSPNVQYNLMFYKIK